MRTYPEWFVGGPWHGRDKLVEHPNVQSAVRVCYATPQTLDILGFQSDLEAPMMPSFQEYTYYPKRASIFGELLTVWVGESDANIWLEKLGQLILKPHRTDSDPQGQDESDLHQIVLPQHRTSWLDGTVNFMRIEEEINRYISTPGQEFARDIHNEITRRKYAAAGERTNSGELWIKVDDQFLTVKFIKIQIYEDLGDEQNFPGWTATAQDQGTTPVGFTGYGPTKVSAVLALLADKLGYYARLTDYGKGRLR
jgi:hypothetical protein